jgi:hypothetical protein
MFKLSLRHFAAACSPLLLVVFLSACGGGEPQPEANASATAAMAANSRSSGALPAIDSDVSPPPLFVEELEKGASLNAQDLQAAQTLASTPSLSKVAPVGFEKATTKLVPIYRFFNTLAASHFYTASAAERDAVIANVRTLQYEGVAFYASPEPARGLSPVYRFYNSSNGVHLYTISESEKNNIQRNIPALKFEGIAYYASQVAATATSAIRRFFVRDRGFHFYSSSPEEAARIRATLPNFVDEGPAYYALTSAWTRPADVDLTLGRWVLTGKDSMGTRWDGSELIFTQQVANGTNYSILARVNFVTNGSPRGWETFAGTLYADGHLEMSGTAVAQGYDLITADWQAVLNVAGNQFLNGTWNRVDGRVIPGTWTAVR